MSDQNFNTLLQKQDPDRRLAALFAAPEHRDQLLALYAFNHEIAAIAEATSESLIGEMKLTWWRDAVADLYADTPVVRRHAVTEGLAGLTGRVDLAALHQLVAARLDDVTAQPFANLDAVLDYVDRTAVALMQIALDICEATLDRDWVSAAGRAWGLTGLLRAFAYRAAIGRAPVGGDTLNRDGGTPAMLAQGLGGDKAAGAVREVRLAALDALARSRSFGALPAEAVPAVGYVVLVPAYARGLPDDPFSASAEPSLLGRQLRLNWLALTGR